MSVLGRLVRTGWRAWFGVLLPLTSVTACDPDDAGPAAPKPDGSVQADAALHDAAAASLDGAAPLQPTPRLSELVQSLFMPSCVLGRCHVTAAPAGDLSFTGRRLSVYAALVNAPSSELPNRMRVVPFDPDASYLIEKLESAMPPVGEPMPPLGAVPKEEIVRLRAWIAAGARDD